MILMKASMLVMSHLSDAQELNTFNNHEYEVNEQINFAKFVISKCKGNLNIEVDPDDLWKKFKS